MTKGPNHWKPQFINFSRSFLEINKTINFCTENMAKKNKIDVELFQNCKENVLEKVNKKITKLKQKVELRPAKSLLNDPDVKVYLD